MRLVHGIGVVMAELVHDLGNPVMVAFGESSSDSAFEIESAAFPLVVQFVL